MKRSDLLKRLADGAHAQGATFVYVRQGGSHTVYRWNGQNVIIPRHTEINERTALGILRAVGL